MCGVLVSENLRSIVSFLGSVADTISHTQSWLQSHSSSTTCHIRHYFGLTTRKDAAFRPTGQIHTENATRKGKEGTQCLQASLSVDAIPEYIHSRNHVEPRSHHPPRTNSVKTVTVPKDQLILDLNLVFRSILVVLLLLKTWKQQAWVRKVLSKP